MKKVSTKTLLARVDAEILLFDEDFLSFESNEKQIAFHLEKLRKYCKKSGIDYSEQKAFFVENCYPEGPWSPENLVTHSARCIASRLFKVIDDIMIWKGDEE